MISVGYVQSPEEKRRVARAILEALPEWFGIPETREEYIQKSADQPFWRADADGVTAGFLYLMETGKDTAELYVLGVRKEYHRMGIGKAMFRAAYAFAREKGYSFLHVKTVQMGRYDAYDRTNRFYRALGFKEFEVISELWGESNPCQIYVMAIE